MTISGRTFLFNCCVWIMNAILMVVIEGGIFLGYYFYILPQFNDPENSGIVNAILPISMIVGLFIAITISVSVVTWAIKHFELEDKLDPKLIKRYIKK